MTTITRQTAWAVALATWICASPVAAQSTEQVLRLQQQGQTEAGRHQARIESLDDATRALLEQYRQALTAVDELEQDNAELEQLLAVRRQALADMQTRRDNLQRLRLELLPLLRSMGETLQRAVAVDKPFLQQERRLRADSLAEALRQPEQPLPELLRRALQAYLIETGYGYELAVDRGPLPGPNGASRATVDFLRLGRLGLFYLSLDGRSAGRWDAASGDWQPLDPATTEAVGRAVQIVRREAPPQLVRLPLESP